MVAIDPLGVTSRVSVSCGHLAIGFPAREHRTEDERAGAVGDGERARLQAVRREVRMDLHGLEQPAGRNTVSLPNGIRRTSFQEAGRSARV